MVSNIDGTMGHKIEARKHPKHGTRCVIQSTTNRIKVQSLQENAMGNCVSASDVQLDTKISETLKVLKLKTSNLSSTNF